MRQTQKTRSDYRAFSTLTTRWIDNDIYGHMNNAVHYQLFDTAVNGHLLEQGVLDLKLGKTVFLVVETGCQYFKELAFPDIITAGIKVSKLGTSSVTYAVGLFPGEEEFCGCSRTFCSCKCESQNKATIRIKLRNDKVFKQLDVKI